MTELAVRTATPRDAVAVEPLVEDALATLHALRGGDELLTTLGVPATISAEGLSSALCGAALVGVTTIVAELSGVLVGVATALATAEGVDLLGVHAAQTVRRRGVGTALLEAARSIARSTDARFEAIALPGDQTVKSLLESAGFKARQLRMSAER